MTPKGIDRTVGMIIRGHAKENPIALREIIIELCWRYTPASERRVKGIVSKLVNDCDLPIVSRREPPYGYFWARTPAELIEGAAPIESQGIEMLRRAERLKNPMRLRAWCGQEQLDF